MNILFVEKITLPSLLWLASIGRSYYLIRYFDQAAPRSLKMLGLLRKARLIPDDVRQIDCHLGDIRNGTGASEYKKIIDRAREIGSRICKEQLEQDPLINAMGSVWTRDKILLNFEKLVEREIDTECLRMGLVRWLMQNEIGFRGATPTLLVERKHWFPYLKEEARTQNIRLITFCNTGFLKNLPRIGNRTFSILGKVFRALVDKLMVSRTISSDQRSMETKPSNSTLAVRYWYRNLSFDTTERSEFFWLNGVNIPTNDVFIYDYVSNRPIDPDTARSLHERGIRIFGNGPGIQSSKPSLRIVPVFVRVSWKLMTAVVKSLLGGKSVSPYIFGNLILLSMEYSFWYDFFRANKVRANLGTLNTSVGQVLAMDHLGGVTMGYQYSASNSFYPTKMLSAGENIQFVFSSVFEDLYKNINAPVDYMVKTGFIYDGAIRELTQLNRGGEVRRQLLESGAQFILCFFDENTVNRWDILCSDEDAVRDYEYLLKWLLSDPTLGIVFKPKSSPNLFQRIASASGLIKQARQTGRCQFLTSDMLYGNIFPAEAALTADICIGKLLGISAALEARLANKPTVLVDTEGLKSHPFYRWGKGRVIFENWDSLRQAVEQYRLNPESDSRLGNWNPELSEMDPFQDGQAGLRMGNYVSWVYDALKKGIPREKAMAEAAAMYARHWGEQNVTYRNM